MSHTPSRTIVLAAVCLCFCAGICAAAGVDDPLPTERPRLSISPLDRAPTLEEFLGMRPPADLEARMTHITGFTQRDPEDGSPASQRTDVYLGYDSRNLYIVFIAHDDEPDKMRARVSRRESVFGDEIVEIQLDTFNDQRRAYSFVANPHGIQWDALWTEGSGFDDSWDTVWQSRGRPTDSGYVVLMTIPFKSLRFPPTADQTWGLVLVRDIPRNNESSFWPRVSNRVEGRLNQEATITGLSGISPGRNIQLIPYHTSRNFRVLDRDDARFREDSWDPDIGLDAKLVLNDSLALDITANPDFSQVESDRPQVTVNERFEVFFPEKRPFFLENSDLFQSPINLLFTRRIADPSAGVRLTGKLGPWSLGVLAIDDEAPGKSVDFDDPLAGERAKFGVFRLTRDILEQSKIGFFLTDRDFDDSGNRVGGIDGRIKIGENWDTRFQAVASTTRTLDDERLNDPAYTLAFNRQGRGYATHIHYRDIGRDFRTEAGFVRRTDIRDQHWSQSYTFRPEGPKLINWRPNLFVQQIDDHDGLRLEWRVQGGMRWEFRRQTRLNVEWFTGRERLRPIDFFTLPEAREYPTGEKSIEFRTEFIAPFTLGVEYGWGDAINFVPPSGQVPVSADRRRGQIELTLRPAKRLRIDTEYIFVRLEDEATDQRIFLNQIARNRVSWQFNKRLTLRAILQYEKTTPDPALTSLERTEVLNGDLLLTYLVNPWTALYLGYNANYENVEIVRAKPDREVVRTDGDLIRDARQIFVKVSYLFRF